MRGFGPNVAADDKLRSFRLVWIGRGLRLPPSGEADDPKGQRGLLWQVLDARPGDLVRWVAEAPGKTSHAVVEHVIARWHEARAEAGVDDEPPADERDLPKAASAQRLGDILAGLGEPEVAKR